MPDALPRIDNAIGFLKEHGTTADAAILDTADTDLLSAQWGPEDSDQHTATQEGSAPAQQSASNDRELKRAEFKRSAMLSALRTAKSQCDAAIAVLRRKLKQAANLQLWAQIFTVVATASFLVALGSKQPVVAMVLAVLSLASSILTVARQSLVQTLDPTVEGGLGNIYPKLVDARSDAALTESGLAPMDDLSPADFKELAALLTQGEATLKSIDHLIYSAGVDTATTARI